MNEPPAGHHPPPEFPPAVRFLATISRKLAVLEGFGIAGCLVALVGLATAQFVGRNLRLHGFPSVPETPPWVDGVIRHSVFLLGFLGAAYATYTGRHIRIDAMTRLARPRFRLALRLLTTVGALVVVAVLIRAGMEFFHVCQEESGELGAQSQLFTSARGALVIVSGLVLVGFHFSVQAAIDGVYLITGRPIPAHWISEPGHGEAAVTPVADS